MNFKIKRTTLLHALSKTTKAVSIRSPLPVLTGIKFDLQDNQLVLLGSDSDITIQTTIPAGDDLEITSTGAVVLSAHYILEIIRKMDSDFVTIEIIDGLLTRIQGSNSEFNLNGTDAMDYPRIDLSKNGTHFLMNAMTLKHIISQTKFAASDQETRPILTGINFKARNSTLECIATDGYRLAKKNVELDEDVTFNITIPQKSLDEIGKIIEKEGTIEMYVSDRKVLFIFDGNIIQTRLIDGSYPDTSRLIPSEDESFKLEVDSAYLLGAMDRVSLLSNEKNNIIKLELSSDKVVLSSFNQEVGSVEENLSAAFYKGEPLQISFSCNYATDAIKSFTGNKIKITFTGEMKPFIIRDLEKNDVLQLVLPVRTY